MDWRSITSTMPQPQGQYRLRITDVIVNDVVYHYAFEFYFRDLVVDVIWCRELLKIPRVYG